MKERIRQAINRVGRAESIARLALVFMTAWAIRCLVTTGGEVLNLPLGHLLRSAPAASQAQAGDGFAQSLQSLRGSIPNSSRVLIVWRGPSRSIQYLYGYFWSTYWLSPRKVQFVLALDSVPSVSPPDAILLVAVKPAASEEIAGFRQVARYEYPDGYAITAYQRSNG